MAAVPEVPLPLAKHQLIATDELESFIDSYSRIVTPIGVMAASRRPFQIRANGAAFGLCTVLATAFDGDLDAGTSEVGDAYMLTLPLGGSSRIVVGRDRVVSSDSSGSVTSPAQSVLVNIRAGHRSIGVVVPKPVMVRALAGLGTTRGVESLSFDPALSLTGGLGVTLTRLLLHVTQTIDEGLMTPLVAASLSDAVIHHLLEHQPHSHAQRLAAPERPAPRALRLAEAYIDANLDSPLTATDIAAQAGVNVRALNAGFRAHRGRTAMEHVRERRLALARTLLARGEVTSVTEAALLCGFSHLGRFSVRYHEAFGEPPHMTLRRSRHR